MEMMPGSRVNRSQDTTLQDLASKIEKQKKELLNPKPISAGFWQNFEWFATINARAK